MSPDKTTILVVDDEPNVLLTVQAILEREGYDVDGINDPSAALQAIRTRHYDLVLTDASWMAQTGNPGHSALFAIAGGSATSPTAAYHQSPALVDVDGRAGDNVTFSGGLRFNKMPIFIINPLQDELFVRAYIVPSS